MGIFIHLAVSKSVAKAEWRKVYGETLKLAKAFQLAETRTVNCRGVDVLCLTPTKERKTEGSFWNGYKPRTGWQADGDYETMCTAESYHLFKELADDEGGDPDAGDAMMGALPSRLDYDWDDPRVKKIFRLWGDKTQGEPYHMYLLAIGCLIESRLGKKAFVYGDITRGQCKKAVELANGFLKTPIDIPARCDLERFFQRVSELPLTELERMEVFEAFYLGEQSAEFGELLRANYSAEACAAYWKGAFSECRIGTIGFGDNVNKYLTLGFDLEELCSLISFDKKKGETEQYKEFIRGIMDAKLHVKDKNCTDPLAIDQEDEHPYGIWSLFAQFAFIGARNRKVDRYIPIEEVRSALISGLRGKMSAKAVNAIIDEYLDKEAKQAEVRVTPDMTLEEMEKAVKTDASEALRQGLENKRQALQEHRERYDITDFEDLLYYEPGNTMPPGLAKSLGKSYPVYHGTTKEKTYKDLMKESPLTRCLWLAKQNRYLLLRDEDWEDIFDDIEENPKSFERYYPMARIDISKSSLAQMVRAMVLNDDLYAYCQEAAKLYAKDDDE